MTSKRMHLVLLASLALLFVGLIAGTVQINSLLTKKAAKLTELKAKNMALSEEQTVLKKSKREIAKYAELHKITRTIVPEDKNQAEAVREIVKIAGENGVSLASITFPASTLGTTLAKPGAGAAAPATTAPPPAAANSKTNALSQLEAVKNIPGVYSLLITITSDPSQPVPYNRFIDFLSDLEHNRRTAQVNTINIEPDPENRNQLSFTLTLNGYIKP